VDGSEGVSRRDLIKQAAVGAGVVWATPVIVTRGTPASAGTPAPCDCDNPPNPPKSVRCDGLSHCVVFFCFAEVAPCDNVRVICSPDVACEFTFTAGCQQTRDHRAGGTITSINEPFPGSCEARGFRVGDQVEFDYGLF
jgi:hypothetical protein